MKLMCTACQQWLQVGDEFAGQRMKCPLCNNIFSVPALPPDATLEVPGPPPIPQNPIGSPPTSAGGSTPMFTGNQDSAGSAATSGGSSEVYKVSDDPKPMSPAASPQTSVPPPLSSIQPKPTPKSTPPSTPQGYTSSAGFSIKPEILQWVPVGCLAVVFILQLFAWVKFAPGGENVATQNAWQAAFGLVSVDNDLKSSADVVKGDKDKVEVGASVLSIFYLLFFLVSLGVVAAIAALPFINVPLPPQVQQLLPWRWAVCAGAVAIPFFFLGLQVVSGYTMEDQVKTNTKADLKKYQGDYDTLNTEGKKRYDMAYGMAANSVYQTWWVKLALVLHIVALAASGLMFWYTQRGDNRPLPRLELMW